MKRYGHLWEGLVSWDNLLRAARKARRGKRDRGAVQAFEFDLEHELLTLQQELETGAYRPGDFRSHWIYRPKKRLISAAPYRDRVVHHAIMNVLEPILDRHFHPDSFACRQRKGTHGAVDRLQGHMRRYRYAVQCDIRKFFPSIDHEILKTSFRRLIKDPRLLMLLDLIVDHSNPQEPVFDWFAGDDLFAPVERRKGLPIGNLTSQWFANWYLNRLDHFVTSGLGLGAYVRYCDDFILLSHDKEALRAARDRIREYLATLRLRIHDGKCAVVPVRGGLRFVGYRVWPGHRLLPKANVRAFRKRLRSMQEGYRRGDVDWPQVKRRIDSWLGHARHADTRHLIKQLSKEFVFSRGKAVRPACAARRVLEQQSQELPRDEPQQEHARQPQPQQRFSGGGVAALALSVGSP